MAGPANKSKPEVKPPPLRRVATPPPVSTPSKDAKIPKPPKLGADKEAETKKPSGPQSPEDSSDGVPMFVPMAESQERPTAETMAEDVEPKMLYQSRLEVGDQIPGTSYRILEWIGEGAAGVVYRCEHVELERPAALKILRPDVAPDSRRAQLFRAEAKVASRSRTAGADGSANSIALGSPYVVDVFDFGELPDGRMWFAMELLDGRSLSRDLGRDLDGDKWSPAKAIGVLRQVCKGLGAAHDAGFIHRDVKPHNIMLVKRGSRSDHVKLVDFGVAAAIERGRDDDFLAGTPHYMAPEQARGSDYDQRLDVYGLGCVAYRMVTGRPPFLADSVMALLRMHKEEAPVPPHAVEGCESIPKPLSDAILGALEKDPDDRYPSMAEFEAALCEAQITARIRTEWDHLPLPRVDKDRVARLERDMPKPQEAGASKRSPWLLAIAGALVLSTGGTAVWALTREPETAAQRDQVDQLVETARAAGAKANYVYPPADEPGAMTAYRAVLEMEAIDTKRATEASVDLRAEFAETLTRLGDFYWEKPGGRPFSADYYAQALLFNSEDAHAQERNVFTPGELATLREAAKTGDFSETNLRTGEVLSALATSDEEQRDEKLQEAVGEAEARAASTQANLVALLDDENETKRNHRKKKKAPAVDRAPQPEATAVPAEEPELPELDAPDPAPRNRKKAAGFAQQGQAALARGQRMQAEALFHRALAADGRNNKALSGLCRVLYDRGQYRSSIRYCRKATITAPNNAGHRIRLGDAYYKEFRYAEAREQYLKAKKLGSKKAKDRLAKVNAKLGK